MKQFVFAYVFCLCFCLTAADLTTKSGKTYSDYTVFGITTRGLQIMHASGGCTIPFDDLPDDVRSKYREKEEIANKNAEAARERQACMAEQKKDNDALAKIAFYPGYLYVDSIHKNFLICRYDGGTRITYCIVTDIPDMDKLATGDRIKNNRDAVDNTRRPKHQYQIESEKETQIGEYIMPENKNSVGNYSKHNVTYYFGHCKGCGDTTQRKTNLGSVKAEIAERNKNDCLSIIDFTPATTVLYDTGRKSVLRWGDTVRVYTYSRTRALSIIHPLSKIVISGNFDGDGVFLIDGDRITYKHGSWDRPKNIMINGKAWKNLDQPFLLSGWFVVTGAEIQKKQGRDQVEYSEEFGCGKLLIDDSTNGSDNYIIEITAKKQP